MRDIIIRAIRHREHRYPTCGDYYETKEGLQVRVSKMQDPRYEFLVALHELIEAKLCEHRGVSISAIDAFDFAYEDSRPEGDESEPGDDPQAPYYREHQFATIIEKFVALELGVNWEHYCQAVLDLDEVKPERR